jgi:hypothetical protein
VVLHLRPTESASGAIHVSRKDVRHAPGVPEDFGSCAVIRLRLRGTKSQPQDNEKPEDLQPHVVITTESMLLSRFLIASGNIEPQKSRSVAAKDVALLFLIEKIR